MTKYQFKPVTSALIAINVILYLVVCFMEGPTAIWAPSIHTLLDWGANFGPLTLSGEYWRLVSYAFLHGHLAHLAINMYVLAEIGEICEDSIGKCGYLAVYFLTGIAAGLASMVFQPTAVSVGASGAIFGIFGATFTCGQIKGLKATRASRKRRFIALGIFVAINLIFGVIIPGIDNAAHMGGLASGLLLGYTYTLAARHHVKWLPQVSMVLFAVASVLGFIAISYQLAGSPKLAAHNYFVRGFALMRESKFDEALPLLDKAEQLLPYD